jgi:hypothetical protein
MQPSSGATERRSALLEMFGERKGERQHRHSGDDEQTM